MSAHRPVDDGARVFLAEGLNAPTGMARRLAADMRAGRLALRSVVTGFCLDVPEPALAASDGAEATRIITTMPGRGMADVRRAVYLRRSFRHTAAALRGDRLVDTVVVRVGPERDGRHSLGPHVGFLPELFDDPDVRVVAEVDPDFPSPAGACTVAAARVDALVAADSAGVALGARPVGAVDRAIAAHVATLVPEGAAVQVGIGSVSQAVIEQLAAAAPAGICVRSGAIGDGLAELVAGGRLSGGAAPAVVVACIIGSAEVVAHAARLPSSVLGVVGIEDVHRMIADEARPLVAVNSALEVDLSGAANLERVGSRWVSGLGGQPDFMHTAHRGPGSAVLALPASRLVPRLRGPVGTPASTVDAVVTEHGVAHLAGLDAEGRAVAVAGVAGPHGAELLAAWERDGSGTSAGEAEHALGQYVPLDLG